MKHPAKIVHNGRIVKDAFPHWDQLLKSYVACFFRFINAFQLHLLQPAHNQSSSEHRSMPPVPSSESQAMPQSVPRIPLLENVGNAGISTSAHTHIIAGNSESGFRAPQIPVTIIDKISSLSCQKVAYSITSSKMGCNVEDRLRHSP